MKSLSHVQLLATPMNSSLHQAPPSMGFSRQEYWSGLPFKADLKSQDSEQDPVKGTAGTTQGFLLFGTTDILGQTILCCWGDYPQRLAAPLAFTQQTPVALLRYDNHMFPGTSLVVQWLRNSHAMPGMWVPFLVRELRSHMPWSKPTHHNNWAWVLQQESQSAKTRTQCSQK